MSRPETPWITLVMAAYNRAHTLDRAVRSVTSQPFADWQLVIVDDGSRDDTLRLARSYDDPRIEVVAHPENRGVTAAKNTGFDHARGQWVATLDSDDELAPGALQRLHDTAASIDPDVASITCHCIDARTGRRCGSGLVGSQYTDMGTSMRVSRGEHWGMFRRETLGAHRFNESLFGMEGVLWVKILRGVRWYYLDEGLRIYHTEGDDRIAAMRFGDQRRDERLYRSYRAIVDDEPDYLDALRALDPAEHRRMLARLLGQFALEGDVARFDRVAAWARAVGDGASVAMYRALLRASPVAKRGRAMLWRLRG